MKQKHPASLVSGLAGMLTAFLILFAGSYGCAKLDPGTDPIVVRCEQTQKVALSAFDEFLKFDASNPGLPVQVHKVADLIRVEAPRNLVALDVARKTYESDRTKNNAGQVTAILDAIQSQLETISALKK